ncbi:MAG: MFS transporter [Bauldia sp.]|uniref:MFS transporter n=1 Tax=Bauldia sp. TaxID=2575872 RepID=UPI001DDB5E85|nr:MFS transporter [Bauldia sp.]MCB1497241.1 MFS transporter [Bauldia sp.]
MNTAEASEPGAPAQITAVAVLTAISLSHFLNDMMQSLLPAIYPILKESFHLDFAQIGFITLAFQFTASLLQPLIGLYTDRWPKPYSLTAGMGSTLAGLVLLSVAHAYWVIVVGAAMVGLGSAIFHPESSRVARLASGGRFGLAQSVFQVGGNVGTAIGPLLAALIIVPFGQSSIAWFSVAALLGMIVLFNVGTWYRNRIPSYRTGGRIPVVATHALPPVRILVALAILTALIFSKFIYLSSLTSYYTFYLIDRFGVSVQQSQVLLFVFLLAVATGTVAGGLIGDRYGRKIVIWVSILGTLPFTIALPYAGFYATVGLSMIIGLILASAFSAIVVMGHTLLPSRIGMISGLFFGFAFGIGGLGAAALGVLADHTSITTVFKVCSFLPAVGLLTVFLPNVDRKRPAR